ncbi:MAG: hypothetical protein AAF902_24530, partial [Chloroflexota bacterium]
DDVPPSTAIRVITRDDAGIYTIGIDGSDGDGIGIEGYTVESRVLNSRSAWTTLEENTAARTIVFNPPDPSVQYEFRVIGIDALGNVEAVSDEAKATSEDAVEIRPALYFPVIRWEKEYPFPLPEDIVLDPSGVD